jgi:dihydroorotase/N-acyl-D-amino-acid deacylase
VGAATVRQYVKGMQEGEASPAEMEQMQGLVRNAMLDGAFGVASALIYPPGSYANARELAGIAKAMSPYGGVYITHMRSEADHLTESIEEALRSGARRACRWRFIT